ncbi:MAG: biliverdin-producing heme oxygenase [Anaerolineales bacterium]|nr:biliverdin-producing heme oxygenase [Anaerolineales bacterium]
MSLPPLSLRLREGTKDSHRLAETTPFIRAFFAGRLTQPVYANFLAQLRHVYAALEAHFERHRAHPIVGALYLPELHRTAALDADLAHFDPSGELAAQAPHPATARYVERLAEAAGQRPDLLVAHHYTRYLGDLSGGQALRRIVIKMFPSAAGGAGLAFYDFPAISNHSAFKDAYRDRLDALPVDEPIGAALVAEANRAFDLNRAVFAEMHTALTDA